MEYNRIFTNKERLKYGYYQFLDHFLGRERVFKFHNKSRRKFFNDIHERLKKDGEIGKTIEVERRKSIPLKEFKSHYIKKGIPVIIEGGAKDWGCSKWSLEYFKELYGEEEILFVNHEKMEDDYERLQLKDIIDGIETGKGKYYRFYPLLQRHPEHLKDFDYKWMFKARHNWNIAENFQVFIGGKNSYTAMHNAYACNIFTQAYGEKEFYIYPPEQTIAFDPDPAENVYRNGSYRQGDVFNPFEPDYETHPLFKYVDKVRVNLKAGDIFYNPPYWWHAVKNHTNSIGVGYRWAPPLHCFKKSPLYFFLDLFTRNPSMFTAQKLAKKDINLIQLAQTGRLESFMKEKEKADAQL
jgi:histone arginine demethylase JMJD6